jgi:hypothetical protein
MRCRSFFAKDLQSLKFPDGSRNRGFGRVERASLGIGIISKGKSWKRGDAEWRLDFEGFFELGLED